MNIAKNFKISFFHETPAVVASEKFINFQGKQRLKLNRFILLINTTEEDSMFMSY